MPHVTRRETRSTVAWHGWVIGLAVVIGCAGVAAPVSATESTSVRLLYTRDAGAMGCPPPSVLRAAVTARLGRDPFRDDAAALVKVGMTSAGEQIRVLIETENLGEQSRGRREIVGPAAECSELVSSAALALAIAIDPRVLIRPTPAEANESPDAVPTATRPELAKPSPSEANGDSGARASQPWYDLAWGTEATWRGVPGVGLMLELRRGAGMLSFGAQVAGHLEQPRSLGAGSVQVSALQGGLGVCWHFAWLGACGQAAAGAQHFSASGYPDARRGWLPRLAFGPRLEAAGLITDRVGLRFQIEGAFTPQSVELTLAGEVLERLPRWRLGAGAVAFLRFP